MRRFMPTDAMAEKLLAQEVRHAGVTDLPEARFPVIMRSGTLNNGNRVRYILNYSAQKQAVTWGQGGGNRIAVRANSARWTANGVATLG